MALDRLSKKPTMGGLLNNFGQLQPSTFIDLQAAAAKLDKLARSLQHSHYTNNTALEAFRRTHENRTYRDPYDRNPRRILFCKCEC
jgi:hypothetical protein